MAQGTTVDAVGHARAARVALRPRARQQAARRRGRHPQPAHRQGRRLLPDAGDARSLDKSLGSRHRAALGITEETDASSSSSARSAAPSASASTATSSRTSTARRCGRRSSASSGARAEEAAPKKVPTPAGRPSYVSVPGRPVGTPLPSSVQLLSSPSSILALPHSLALWALLRLVPSRPRAPFPARPSRCPAPTKSTRMWVRAMSSPNLRRPKGASLRPKRRRVSPMKIPDRTFDFPASLGSDHRNLGLKDLVVRLCARPLCLHPQRPRGSAGAPRRCRCAHCPIALIASC